MIVPIYFEWISNDPIIIPYHRKGIPIPGTRYLARSNRQRHTRDLN